MTYASRITAAPNVQAALLELARGIDEVLEKLAHPQVELDPWNVGEWQLAGAHGPDSAGAAPFLVKPIRVPSPSVDISRVSPNDDGTNVITIPPVSEEVKERRRVFERQALQIARYKSDDTEDWNEVYAKGGPVWLYNWDRELVMSLPAAARASMVQDLIDTGLTKEAHEMGRDILKEDCEVPDISTGERALGGAE